MNKTKQLPQPRLPRRQIIRAPEDKPLATMLAARLRKLSMSAPPAGALVLALLAGGLSSLVSAPARADDAEPVYSLAVAYQWATVQDVEPYGASYLQDEASAFRVYAGWWINRYLCAEFGYEDLGSYAVEYDVTAGNFDIRESHALELGGGPFVGITGQLALQKLMQSSRDWAARTWFRASAAMQVVDVQLDAHGTLHDTGILQSNYAVSAGGTDVVPSLGFGVGYRMSERLQVSLDYIQRQDVGKDLKLSYSDGTTENYGGRDVRTLGLSLVFLTY